VKNIILTPSVIIDSYKQGIFPMGDYEDDKLVMWCNPNKRAVIPIGELHISRSLRKECIKRNLEFTINKCFERVILKCASRKETWITSPIIQNYIELYKVGYAHSVEVWDHNTLLGGLYGVSIGAAFFAESMFSTSKNGSKFALVALMFLLVKNKFLLLDVQFLNKHLATMGAIEVPKTEFLERLMVAKEKMVSFKEVNSTSIDINLLNTLVN